MKILHTADWHLGKRLGLIHRHEEQVLVMRELINIANEQEVDAVIVAGDLFDNFNPPNESLELLYKTLKQLTNNGQRPVIAIAGNHDSPEKINAPEPLAKECGILFLGLPNVVPYAINSSGFYETTKQDYGFIELKFNKHPYPLRLVLTPYSNAIRLKTYLNIEQEEDDLNALLEKHWQTISDKYCNSEGVNVLVGHQFFANSNKPNQKEPDGERPILGLGGTNLIRAAIVPKSIHYVALGHLHEFQIVKSENSTIVYSGSPCGYSFSEAEQEKCLVIANLNITTAPTLSKLILKTPKVLYNKEFNSVEATINWLQDHPDALVNVTIKLNSFLSNADKASILKAHSGIVNLIPELLLSEEKNSKLTNIDLDKDVRTLYYQYINEKYTDNKIIETIEGTLNEILEQKEL